MKILNFSRLNVLYGAILFVAFILIGRLYFLQIVNGESFSDEADRQYVNPNQKIFSRGSIYFKYKNGDLFPAATLKTGFTLVMNPKLLENPEEAYKKLSGIVEIDMNAFYNKANKKDDPYEQILDRVSLETGQKIEDLNIEGINLYRQRWRFYPGGKLACHTVGFLGFKGDVLEGRYGVERYYDDLLQRKDGNLYTNFFAEVFSNISSSLHKENREGDIILSIEPSVQSFLESEVLKISEKWKTELVNGVIINPKNGEIYALATYPDFDLNNYSQEDVSVFSDPFVENVYEMGSIIKPLTMAIGLDTGAVSAETTYDDKGYLILNGSKISNYDGKGRGVVEMQEVLNQSLNTGVAFVANQVGKEKMAKY
ncbi:hypothetical protein KKG48_03330 [Patescibacteria group bacterium]|nr:hypothetical protein [Patescibacteria group bacterium]